MSFAELDTRRALHPSRATNATWSGASPSRQPNNLARQISQQFPRISNNLSSIRKTLQVKSPNRIQLQSLLDTTSALLANVAIDVKSMAVSKEDTTDPLLARQRRIEHHKLSKDLSSLRSEFQELQRSAKHMLRRSGWYTSSSTVHPLSSATSSALEELMCDQNAPKEPEQRLQLRIASDEELQMNGLMIAERDTNARKIEHGVYDVNAIFSHLGHIVVKQQSTTENTQENLKGMMKHVKKADEEVKKTNPHQRKWGWLGTLF